MQFGISDPPDQINRNVVYDIVCYITYDTKTRTYCVLPKTYKGAYDLQHTALYVQHATLYVTYHIVRQTYDIVNCDIVCVEDTMLYVHIVCLVV